MTLMTKSIQEKAGPQDGVRICIMRRPDHEKVKYDLWMPALSPSHQLLDDYHAQRVDWKGYVKRFSREVIKGQRKFLEFLADIARRWDVTILCWEETPKYCHRRLVAEACKKIDRKLKVILK